MNDLVSILKDLSLMSSEMKLTMLRFEDMAFWALCREDKMINYMSPAGHYVLVTGADGEQRMIEVSNDMPWIKVIPDFGDNDYYVEIKKGSKYIGIDFSGNQDDVVGQNEIVEVYPKLLDQHSREVELSDIRLEPALRTHIMGTDGFMQIPGFRPVHDIEEVTDVIQMILELVVDEQSSEHGISVPLMKGKQLEMSTIYDDIDGLVMVTISRCDLNKKE